MDINNKLELLKVEQALRSENMKLEYRKTNMPKDISMLDYTIISALEKQIPQKAELNVSREHFYQDCGFEDKLNMLCPTCKNYIGYIDDEDADGDLKYNLITKYCSECGQLIEQVYTKIDYARWGIESDEEQNNPSQCGTESGD